MTSPASAPSIRMAQQVLGNAFRFLGLGGNSSARDIHAAAQSRKRSLKLGAGKGTPWDLGWIDKPERTEATLLDALGRLTNIESRLRERLFWFEEAQEENGASQPPTAHDRALRALLLALIEDSDALDEERWRDVGLQWQELGHDDPYWERMLVTESEGGFEPPAGERDIENLRNQALQLAFDPVAERGRKAAFSGETETAARCLRVLRGAGLSESQLYGLEQSLAGPIVAQIHQACEQIQTYRNDINRADDAVAGNVPVCERNQAEFEGVVPLLNQLQALAGADNQMVLQAKEECAVLLHLLALDWTWADEFGKSRDLMVRSQAIGAGTPAEPRIAARIAELDEPAKREQIRQDFFRSNKCYNVRVGGSYSVPRACTCCLGEATLSRSVSSTYQVGNTKTTITMTFPICSACVKHGKNTENALLTQSLLGFAILFVIFFFLNGTIFSSLPSVFSMIAAIGLTWWLMWLIAKKQKLVPLSSKCASRHFPVKMVSAGPGYASVQFLHPDYAEAFANSNKTTVVAAKASKVSREGNTLAEADGIKGILVRQLYVLVVAAILVGVVSCGSGGFQKSMFGNHKKPDDYSYDSSSSSDYTPPTTSPLGSSGTSGSSDLPSSTSGLSNLDKSSESVGHLGLELQLSEARSKLASLRTDYDALKIEFDTLDSKLQQDKTAYTFGSSSERDEMRDRLNKEIDERNDVLTKYQDAEKTYNAQVEVVNDLVRQVNSSGGN